MMTLLLLCCQWFFFLVLYIGDAGNVLDRMDDGLAMWRKVMMVASGDGDGTNGNGGDAWR